MMKRIAYLLVASLSLTSLASCGSDDPAEEIITPKPKPDPVNPGGDDKPASLDDYVAPTDNDDYREVNDWNKRNKWNLANVHDPSVMLADDGYYYMYQTDASYGNVHAGHGHFFCRRSKDMVKWEFLGATMPAIPAWVKTKVNEVRAAMGLGETTINFNSEEMGYWAPTVRRVAPGLYRMYYSLNMPSVPGSGDKMTSASFCTNVIGMMETKTPEKASSWVDKGFVISQYSDQDKNYSGKSVWGGYWKYNAIDPSLVITPEGQHWLIYGSWHSGFAAVELDPATGLTKTPLGNPWGKENEAAYGKRVFTRVNGDRWQGSEGPEVVYRNGYYYMFIAYGQLAHAYHTRVVRSRKVDGPYLDIMGQDFTNGGPNGTAYPAVTHPYRFGKDHGWEGISHCAVWDDGKGNYYYASQQRFPDNWPGIPASNALMLGGVRAIVWTEDGWPLVLPERYGAVPQVAITEAELVGSWQHINLGGCAAIWDDQCHKDVSVDIQLTADHKVTGAWNDGQVWSFDASKNILTIGGAKLYLRREVDWEATPRVPTIVYAGIGADKKTTLWGKKTK